MARGIQLAAPGRDLGIKPALRGQLELFAKALSGDMVFVVIPATTVLLATIAAWEQEFIVELQTADGELHTWFNKAIATGVSIGDDSSAGTASIPSTTLTFVDGIASVTVSGDAEAWLTGDKVTLTVGAATLLGYTVAAKTGVITTVEESLSPSISPSASPSLSPSASPSASPSLSPSKSPSVSPSKSPSASPSASPS